MLYIASVTRLRFVRFAALTLAGLQATFASRQKNVHRIFFFPPAPTLTMNPDFFTDGKNVVFSIVKPFDKLLRTAQINKWCAIVCEYRTNFYDEYKQLGYKLELLLDQIEDTNADNMQLLSA